MRLARAGEGIKSGHGAVFGATFFEDDPVSDEMIGADTIESGTILQVSPPITAQVLEISPITPKIIGAN